MSTDKPSGFDKIAFIYDSLAKLIFGNSIRKAQYACLEDIPEGGNVLILGGGTGWLLEKLMKMKPACKIWYVEASKSMLAKAKEVVEHQPSANLRFIHGTEEDIAADSDVAFDAVITNFYFDLFTPLTLDRVLNQIIKLMGRKAVLLVSDFVDRGVWWQRLLLFVMYRFFRTLCGIESPRLPEWRNHLTNVGFNELKTKSYYGGFIESSVYFLVDE